MTWPTDITGFIAKIIIHSIYVVGSLLSTILDWFIQQCAHQIEATINVIMNMTGIMTMNQTEQLNATAANIGTIANFLSGCICNPTLFWQGITAIVIAASGSIILRIILKIWALIWSGQ